MGNTGKIRFTAAVVIAGEVFKVVLFKINKFERRIIF